MSAHACGGQLEHFQACKRKLSGIVGIDRHEVLCCAKSRMQSCVGCIARVGSSLHPLQVNSAGWSIVSKGVLT